MTNPATFDETDFAALTASDKRALKRIIGATAGSLSALSQVSGVGLRSMEALISKGLSFEGSPDILGRMFGLTDKGFLASEWLHGHKIRIYPKP